MTVITKLSHPVLFSCLEIISHDCGAGAGHPEYAVPDEWDRWCQIQLPQIEAALAELTTEEKEDFAIGELSEALSIAYRSANLLAAHQFFSAFFDDFPEGGPLDGARRH